MNGRVIVDAVAFYRRQKMVPPSLKLFTDAPANDIVTNAETLGEDEEEDCLSVTEDEERNSPDPGDFVRVENMEPLTDEQVMLATPRVRGMDLNFREWCKFIHLARKSLYIVFQEMNNFNQLQLTNDGAAEFLVDDLQDIAWNETMFTRLVLPGGEREVASAACKNKKKANIDFDFVSGKGMSIRVPNTVLSFTQLIIAGSFLGLEQAVGS